MSHWRTSHWRVRRWVRALALGLTAALITSLSGCVLERRERSATPTHAFEQLWEDYRAYYGLFEVKGVDWDALHAEYAPRVNDQMSDAELYEVLVDMLTHLDDPHVTLYPAGNPELPTFSIDLVDGVFVEPPFDEALVEERYLHDAATPHPQLTYGHLAGGLGYIHLRSFDGKQRDYAEALDRALRALADAPGLVVDIRDNPGGFDPLAQYVAGRFTDTRRAYMTVRKRNGAELDEFGPTRTWYVEPTGARRFTGPIALLTTYATQSAGETFALAMRVNPQVVQVGSTTGGAFSDAILRETWNGWAYTISVGDYRAPDGTSFEGVGLAPDVWVENTYDEVRAGRDAVLEAATEWLLAGPP
ncbi:MAG: S41 family peptidase [Myxococcales bacterium]|nr:S41 family peptidase [Myxococcales bacterium]